MWLESFKVRNRLVQHIKNVDINLFPVFVYYNQGLSLGPTIELDSITKLFFSDYIFFNSYCNKDTTVINFDTVLIIKYPSLYRETHTRGLGSVSTCDRKLSPN